MPLPNPRWPLYWDTLNVLLSGQTGTGGQLQGIAQVRNVANPEKNLFPYVGIEFDEDSRSVNGTHEYEIKTDFLISCGVLQPFDPTQTEDIGELAFSQLRQYLDNNGGTGLEGLLNSQPNLAGCISSSIVGMKMFLGDKKGSPGSGVIAWAIYRFRFVDVIRPF